MSKLTGPRTRLSWVTLCAMMTMADITRAQIPRPLSDNVAPNNFLGRPSTIKYGKSSRELAWVQIAGKKNGVPTPMVIWLPNPNWRHAGPVIDVGQMPTMLVDAGFASAAIGADDPKYFGTKHVLDEIGHAIEAMSSHATELRINPRCLILVGNDSAAFYATLLATKPHLLKTAGVDPENIKGMVLIAPDGELGAPSVITNSAFTPTEAKHYFGDPIDLTMLVPEISATNLSVRSFLVFDHPLAHPGQTALLAERIRTAHGTVESHQIVETRTGQTHTYLGSLTSVAGFQFVDYLKRLTVAADNCASSPIGR